MTPQILYALAGFCFVSSITPGPNNMMLLASGANFGLRRSLPHMLGVALGFTLMIVLVGLGLMQVFVAFPLAHDLLKAASVVYLLWLAWKIGSAAPAPPEAAETGRRPMSFLQAVAFQWVNPKAWAMALTALSAYVPAETLLLVAMVAGLFGAINLPCIASWTILGQQMRRFLTSPARLRAFNITMALGLVATLAPILSH
ncbi:MAG: LysE family translocator [Limimaricola sp.]|uniref:LysE family translocator n=1 Tax=Limimaricola sp. TaxID=2211665 RepID=UPI001DCBF376|nr:LysE family translocator [Limimaricola sp.]MBI1418594.1 LysE family translocator [Limimaricola sp.]